ncbi:MAG: hypothetical protein HOQ21_09970 [Dermatophilaceae bacterium]|nr:hypothetical protein [Dermatophilaceae bacterium]
MKGPEHFVEAEDHLRIANEVLSLHEAKFHHDRAIAHGILAVVAAVVTNDRFDGMTVEQLAEWLTVLNGQAVNRG